MTAEPTKRIFIGTFLADAEKNRLAELRQYEGALKAAWQTSIRWVRPEKLHLTWFFLGKVAVADLPEISAICADAAKMFAPQEMQFKVPTFWPAARGARMLVLGPETVPPAVNELAAFIKERCRKFAEREDKKYRPHITLMRFDGEPSKESLSIPEGLPLYDYLPVPLQIDAISVIESHMGPNSSYKSLSDYALSSTN